MPPFPPNAFPVELVHTAFKKDGTYICLHKLGSLFFLGPFSQAGVSSLSSAPELEWTFEELCMGGMLIT